MADQKLTTLDEGPGQGRGGQGDGYLGVGNDRPVQMYGFSDNYLYNLVVSYPVSLF